MVRTAGTKNSMLRRRLVAGIAIAATVLVAPIVMPTAAASADPVSCPSYEFIGARGSGEPDAGYTAPTFGMGKLVSKVYQKVADSLPVGEVTAYGVHYPAVSLEDSLSNYANAAGAFTHISGWAPTTTPLQKAPQTSSVR
jgi:hypothetical protein